MTVVFLAIPLLYYGTFVSKLINTQQQVTSRRMVVTGRVVDTARVPLDGYDVASYWSSNGTIWDEYGNYKPPESTKWVNEGVMAPLPRDLALSLPGGCFRFETVSDRFTFLAISKDRKSGGLVVVNANTSFPVTIVVSPLVRVRGTIRASNGSVPDLVEVGVYPVSKLGHGHFAVCNSCKGEFSFLLPPGEYAVGARSSKPPGKFLTTRDPAYKPHDVANGRVSLTVIDGVEMIDVGPLEISGRVPRQ